MHHVTDKWFSHEVKVHSKGKVMMIRSADDYVCMFQYKADAERFYRIMLKRLTKYGLELAVEKSWLRRLSRFEPDVNNKIEFLGFEFCWKYDFNGSVRMMRRTKPKPKRLQIAIAKVKEWVKDNRHLKGREFVKALN